jgi:hypothetical protein
MTTALAERGATTLAAAPAVTTDQMDLVRRTVAVGATPDELKLYLYDCSRQGVHPLDKLIHFTKRSGKYTPITSIDFMRIRASESGEYAGSDVPLFAGADGVWSSLWVKNDPPLAAMVTVWRLVQGQRCKFEAVARWAEYKPDANDFMWKKMPATMLGKCFDEQTEVLTEDGFQRFADVGAARILQVSADGTLQPVTAIPFVQDYDGAMVTLDSDDLNFSVTPNHDMVTTHGKMEAGHLYEQARTRPKFWIPRVIGGSRADLYMSDTALRLAAAYLADGSDLANGFSIEPSRPRKVAALRALCLHTSERSGHKAGSVAYTATRTITTRTTRTCFVYSFALVSPLVNPRKQIDMSVLLNLSRRQARIFVDTLIEFDGRIDAVSGARRFYTSRAHHLHAFEIACVMAGYAVNRPTERMSDISSTPNFMVTVSDRDAIPVIRWGRGDDGRSKGNISDRTGLELRPNRSGHVWCVTVPSGVIVVRRDGFSMLCGNCAEALALRKGFPRQLAGLYAKEEMDQAGGGETSDKGAPDPPAQLLDTATGAMVPASERPVPPEGFAYLDSCRTEGVWTTVIWKNETYKTKRQQIAAVAEQAFQFGLPVRLTASKLPWLDAVETYKMPVVPVDNTPLPGEDPPL